MAPPMGTADTRTPPLVIAADISGLFHFVYDAIRSAALSAPDGAHRWRRPLSRHQRR